MQIEGGRLVSVTEVGAPVGTCVEVADLLYNVPARLKFLKGEATEASHITELVARVAMAHPQLHVRLRHNGRTALDVPPDRDALGRAQALLGARDRGAAWCPRRGEEGGVRVSAFLGAPELAQTTARGVQLFVGRRPVRDRGLLHAVAMGYGELVPRGRYPIAIVHARRAGRRGRHQRPPAEARGPVRRRERGLRGRPPRRAGGRRARAVARRGRRPRR